ncbi:hypothetical protein MNBD_BACTEROID01-1028 [hydrothermal vent metagenome]|uniref:Anti-sigma factor n=1 Tax=hydrothermal vent metagenome TaxID=652676 RepID=A0A3B0UST0_9ZZZZ
MDKKRGGIEELILKNLEQLNDSEPMEGHFERFEAKLAKQSKQKNSIFRIAWKVAAVAVFAFLAVNQAIIYFSPAHKQITTLSAVSREYSEVEAYYTNAISTDLTQWEQMYNAGLLTEEDNKMMQNNLEEFDQRYSELQEELNANPYDERVINAMLEYYQTKLNVINLIISKLKEVKMINNTKDETEI